MTVEINTTWVNLILAPSFTIMVLVLPASCFAPLRLYYYERVGVVFDDWRAWGCFAVSWLFC